MANPTEDDYCRFLITPWCYSAFVEFYLNDKLFTVAVIDLLPHGISAVYTFFDPALSALSPGVVAILWQIEETKRYIANQREHHRRRTFQEEFLAFLEKHGIEYDPRNVCG